MQTIFCFNSVVIPVGIVYSKVGNILEVNKIKLVLLTLLAHVFILLKNKKDFDRNFRILQN